MEGETLEDRVNRAGPLSPRIAVQMALDMARALVVAEALGTTDYDVTPSRIMLDNCFDVGCARPATELEPPLYGRIINLGLPDASPREKGYISINKEVRRQPHPPEQSAICSLGLTLLFSLLGGLVTQLATEKAFPAKLLKARKIPKVLIALLKTSCPTNSNAPRVSAVDFANGLRRCLSRIVSTQAREENNLRKSIAALTLLAAILLAGVIYFGQFLRPPEISIALLPFQNISNNQTDSFFAEELQDDIRTRLVKIREIKVINRLDSASYAPGKSRDFKSIGRELGVRFLLQGSVRREAKKLSVHVSLIDANKNREMWSRQYSRRLADVSNLQGELASDIADALNAKLTAPERANIRAGSTVNPDAYALFLQGRRLERNPAFAISSYEGAEAAYRQAVALDPGFALAHARLSITAGLLYRFRKPTRQLRSFAASEAQEALDLSPGLGEAHLAMGLYYYRVTRDFASALPELMTAQRLLPNDTEPEVTIAFIHRRQGQWRQARRELENALVHDPNNQECERELNATAFFLRDWVSAENHAIRAVILAPKLMHLRGEAAMISYWKTGDLNPLQGFFADLVGFGDEGGSLTWCRWDAAMLARDFVGAHSALESFPRETLSSVYGGPIPKSYLEGCMYLAQGELSYARQMLEIARPVFEAETIANPNDSLRHARLGLLYAHMGRKEDAIREGERAVEITPISEDAVEGHQWLCNLALIHARVGDMDEAIKMVESLLQEPGCVSPLNEASMTLSDLRLRWQWDPLRDNPRLRAILAKPEPETIYQ